MNNMSKYFDQMWKKRCKKKKIEKNDKISKLFSSIENIEIPKKPKFKEQKKRLEFLNFKGSQFDNCTSNLSSHSSNISKQLDSMGTHNFEEFDVATSQATELELNNQASHKIETEALIFNCQALQNAFERIFVNSEDSLIHTKDETFSLEKWIDKEINSNSQLHSLNAYKKTTTDDTQSEIYFKSKFNEKYSSIEDNVKGHLGNKIPYEKRKGVSLEHLEGFNIYSDGSDIEPRFKESKPNENAMTFNSELNLLNELNESNINLDTSTNEDDNDSYDYKGLSNNCSDVENGLSLEELQSLNETSKLEQLHLQHFYNLHPSEETNCDNIEINAIPFKNDDCLLNSKEGCKFKVGRKILVEARDKLRFDKNLFYDSVSSVQPYLQDNLEGPISHPSFKIESAHVSSIQGISPCSSLEPSLINKNLKHQDFKRLTQRSRSLNKIVVDNKELNTFNGLKGLPKETQEFLEKLKKKNSLCLSKYQQIANEVTKMMSLKYKENLQPTNKLKNDLQDISKYKATMSITRFSKKETNLQNSSQKQQVQKKILDSPRNKKKTCGNKCDALNALEIKKKIPKKNNDKILHNIKFGSDARYYKLTEEEEELVEQILAQPDPIDDMTNDGCINASYASTGYDFDEDNAKIIAQINVQLEHLELQYYDSRSISNKCDIEDECNFTSNGGFPSRAISLQCELSSKVPFISTKQGNTTICTRKSSNHSCNKIQSECMSTMTKLSNNTKIKHYLKEQRIHRQFQKRIEEIDRILKELETMELPKLSEKELQDLIMECKKEQGMSSNMSIESLAMHDSTSTIENTFISKNPSQCSKMFENHQQSGVAQCSTIHINPLLSTLSNCNN